MIAGALYQNHNSLQLVVEAGRRSPWACAPTRWLSDLRGYGGKMGESSRPMETRRRYNEGGIVKSNMIQPKIKLV